MRIVVDVKSYYDWLPVTVADVKDGAPHSVDQAGKAMKRVHVKRPSHTEVAIPDAQVDATLANFESDPVPFMRLRKEMTPTRQRDYPESWVGVLAWHLGEKVMPLHAPVEDWGRIQVDGDKKTQTALNRIFKESDK